MQQTRIGFNLGSVYGSNCPGCGRLSTVRPPARVGGKFRRVEICDHFTGARVAADGSIELTFEARPAPRD